MVPIQSLGWCAPLENAELVRDAGYDYLEPPLAPLLLPETGVNARQRLAKAPLPTPVFSNFFPRDMRVVGPAVDRAHLADYLARAAELLQKAGAQCAVMGSAWARNVPHGFSRDAARQQILECCMMTADAFAGSGVVIGLEAQNRKEANIITSLGEAAWYARTVNRPEIRIIADLYHMEEEAEPLSVLTELAPLIVHVQLADSGRLNPGTGHYDYDRFFRLLRDGGYAGTVSVECMIAVAPDQMRRSQEFLRRFWAS
jgi:sugar phosphate isomerase/epimerase